MKLIYTAFATLQGYREGDAANLGSTNYHRCLVVALASAKQQNPDCTVALVTNSELPQPYAAQLAQAGVEIWHCPFDRYLVDAQLEWSLAFYKLCALDWVLRNKTKFCTIAMLDSDTYTVFPLEQLWRECEEAVLLYQVPHPADQSMAQAISDNYNSLYRKNKPQAVLTHFGGELIAGSTARLADFMAQCAAVYADMQAAGLQPHEGDEFITCAAAYRSLRSGAPVRAANAYICRYWLGARHYFVSTNYCNVPICIMHLPGMAKSRQLRVLYHLYSKNGAFPPKERVWRLCGMPAAHPPLLRTLWVRLLARIYQ